MSTTKTKPKARLETVTPKKAAEWLKKNTNNRSVNIQNVRRYAHDMRDGNWEITGTAITFNGDGSLLDGQNRLHACVEADKPFESLVVRGISSDAQHVMDTGSKRALHHALKIKGVDNAITVAAAARWLYQLENDGYVNGQARFDMTIPTMLEYYDSVAEIEELTRQWQKLASPMPKSVAVGLLWAAQHHSDKTYQKAVEFVEGVHSGADLAETDPRLKLRNLLIDNRSAKSRGAQRRLSTEYISAVIIKAFRHYIDGDEVKVLRLWNGERPNLSFIKFGPDTK